MRDALVILYICMDQIINLRVRLNQKRMRYLSKPDFSNRTITDRSKHNLLPLNIYSNIKTCILYVYSLCVSLHFRVVLLKIRFIYK